MSGRPDSSSNLGGIGGQSEQSLQVANLANHTHGYVRTYTQYTGTGGSWGHTGGTTYTDGLERTTTSASGSGQAFSIMPPYIRMVAHVRAG